MRIDRSAWKPLTAVAVALALFGGATAGVPILANLAFFGAVVSGAMAAAVVLLTRRDKYDLRLLAEVHESEDFEEPVFEEQDFDSVHCIHCGTVYSGDIPTCPNCGRR
jgi:hypothetical protein